MCVWQSSYITWKYEASHCLQRPRQRRHNPHSTHTTNTQATRTPSHLDLDPVAIITARVLIVKLTSSSMMFVDVMISRLGSEVKSTSITTPRKNDVPYLLAVEGVYMSKEKRDVMSSWNGGNAWIHAISTTHRITKDHLKIIFYK